MKHFLSLALALGLSISAAVADDIGCSFPTADDARPCVTMLDASGGVYVQVGDRDTHSVSQDWTKDGVPVFGVASDERPAPVVRVNEEAVEHARQTYNRVLEDGGCNAAVIPHEIASYCWNHAMNKTNPNGPIGASDGGE